MKKRFISEFKKHIIIFSIGFAYYLWVVLTSIYIPCVFKMITGLKCPGCGITHMIVSACRFDFENAFLENPLMFVALPVMGIIYAVREIYYIRTGTKMKSGKVIHFCEYMFLALIIIFWVVRNIPHK